MTTMSTARAIRRCPACGIGLHGKVAYPIMEHYYCATIHCLSRGYVDNIHKLEPSERERIGARINTLQYDRVRRNTMERVYGIGTIF